MRLRHCRTPIWRSQPFFSEILATVAFLPRDRSFLWRPAPLFKRRPRQPRDSPGSKPWRSFARGRYPIGSDAIAPAFGERGRMVQRIASGGCGGVFRRALVLGGLPNRLQLPALHHGQPFSAALLQDVLSAFQSLVFAEGETRALRLKRLRSILNQLPKRLHRSLFHH